MDAAQKLSSGNEALNSRPKSVRIAVYLMMLNILIFQSFSGYKYLVGVISQLQLNANLLVLSVLFFLPWRIWLAGEYSRFAYTLMLSTWISTSVVPLFFGIFPADSADSLALLLVVPVEIASFFFLYAPTTTAWFLKTKNARAGE